jgi:hypothetical protein
MRSPIAPSLPGVGYWSDSGPKVAAIPSVVESCRPLKLLLRDYLAAVLPGLADLPIQRLAHSRCVGRPALIDSNGRVVGVETVGRSSASFRHN